MCKCGCCADALFLQTEPRAIPEHEPLYKLGCIYGIRTPSNTVTPRRSAAISVCSHTQSGHKCTQNGTPKADNPHANSGGRDMDWQTCLTQQVELG